jgi:hypothetical protein
LGTLQLKHFRLMFLEVACRVTRGEIPLFPTKEGGPRIAKRFHYLGNPSSGGLGKSLGRGEEELIFSTALDCAGVRKSLICNDHIFHFPLSALLAEHHSRVGPGGEKVEKTCKNPLSDELRFRCRILLCHRASGFKFTSEKNTLE